MFHGCKMFKLRHANDFVTLSHNTQKCHCRWGEFTKSILNGHAQKCIWNVHTTFSQNMYEAAIRWHRDHFYRWTRLWRHGSTYEMRVLQRSVSTLSEAENSYISARKTKSDERGLLRASRSCTRHRFHRSLHVRKTMEMYSEGRSVPDYHAETV